MRSREMTPCILKVNNMIVCILVVQQYQLDLHRLLPLLVSLDINEQADQTYDYGA